MTVTVRASTPMELGYLAQRAGLGNVVPGLYAMSAVDERGRLLGVVGYDGWMDNAVCCHIALEKPSALRHLLGPGFRVPFLELKREVLIAKVLSTNERSLRLVRHLGFREVCRGRDWVRPGVDLVIHEMRREDCAFLRERKAA